MSLQGDLLVAHLGLVELGRTYVGAAAAHLLEKPTKSKSTQPRCATIRVTCTSAQFITWQSCQSLRVGRASRSWRAASAWPGSSDLHCSASGTPAQNCRRASSRGWRWRPVCSRMNWRRRRRVWQGRRGCHCPGSGGSCAASSTAPSSPSWAWSLVTAFDPF